MTSRALPEELRAEQRWSSFQERQAPQWTQSTDERLVALVTRSTVSGERFPVGVNWLEVSRVVDHSPVECVKRYALLHLSSDQQRHGVATAGLPVNEDGVQLEQHDESASEDVRSVPLSGLSSSNEDLGGSPRRQSFSGFSTPLTSPKLSSLDTSDEFGVGIGSPGSPPPFAVRKHNAGNNGAGGGAVSSPFRWENLLNESAYSSPILKSPPHARFRAAPPHLRTGGGIEHFGVDDDAKSDTSQSSLNSFPTGVMSPRIIHGTQDHTRPILDPNYAANIINHAFKGMKVDAPTASSPRMIRTISNSEFPFLKEDEAKRAAQLAQQQDASAAAFLASPRTNVPNLVNEQQLQAHMMKMSAMSTMSSFHGDNPFSGMNGVILLWNARNPCPYNVHCVPMSRPIGSLTQSALEDAFLDMAGSRLDASSVLLNSRFSMGQSRLRLDQIQALEKEREQLRSFRTGAAGSASAAEPQRPSS